MRICSSRLLTCDVLAPSRRVLTDIEPKWIRALPGRHYVLSSVLEQFLDIPLDEKERLPSVLQRQGNFGVGWETELGVMRKRYGGGQTWRYFPTWSVRSQPGYKYEDMIHIIESTSRTTWHASKRLSVSWLIGWLVPWIPLAHGRLGWLIYPFT